MIPYNLPINKLLIETREDLAQSLLLLLQPCEQALVKKGSGLFVGNESAHYSQHIALLEGWSRLLWGVVPLRCGGFSWKEESLHAKGLIEGTDPQGPHYWGAVEDYDQRMVEMAAIALGLLLTPQYYWDPLSLREQNNLCTWLGMINTHQISPNNWLFFRVLVNLAFEKLERPELCIDVMQQDLEILEGMYAGDGWYRDHIPFDNYNPLAMQYYALIYCVFRKEQDPERCERFAKRAGLFAKQHLHVVTADGSFVPDGRSLTSRFAVVAFYSACAFANLEVVPWGVMKGIVLRSIRWWFQQPIFDRDGFLTVGYVYPCRSMAEQYNAPGSPYWALKAYLILALSNQHPFWQSEELPLPKLEETFLLKQPGAIMQRTNDDVIMLNAGQYPAYHMLQIAEKYAKFAYSARYTFSVAASYYEFEQTGCDNMLFLSDDSQNWRARRESEVKIVSEGYLCTIWRPYPDVAITTYLIPAGMFHIRVHTIQTGRKLYTKEGGFAIELYRGWEISPPIEEVFQNSSSLSLVLPWDISHISDPLEQRKASRICPVPNVNLAFPTTIVPILSSIVDAGSTEVLISCVGAWRNTKSHPEIPSIVFDTKEKKVIIGSLHLSLH
ncbi:MAG: DUF2264 domain-containing protein [Sphaerochaetaceae bacterium]